MDKDKLKLSTPWCTYWNKVKVLFDRDPEITISNLDDDYHFVIEVRNHEKFRALEKLLPTHVNFGTVMLAIELRDVENDDVTTDDAIKMFETIFKGNPIVKDIKAVADFTGTKHGFIRFQPEVIQFFNDDLTDYDGNWTGLAEKIAEEVFMNTALGIHFCTAPVIENGADK